MSRISSLTRCLIVSLLFLSTAWAQQVEFTKLDGKKAVGELTDWQGDQLTIDVEGKATTIPARDLLAVRMIDAPVAKVIITPTVELVDGTRIPCTEFTVADRQAKIVTPLSPQPIAISTQEIRNVQFVALKDGTQPWQQDLTADVLVITKKDSDQTETLEGIIGDVLPEQVLFSWDGDTIPVKRTKIAALGYFHVQSAESGEPVCQLQLTSGALLPVATIKRSGDDLQVTTVGKLEFTLPLGDIVSADYSLGKLTYLSDLEPLTSSWTPLVALPTRAESIQNFGEFRRNLSFTGSPLTLSWPGKDNAALTTYDKGLAIRSRSELEYRLPRGLRRFVAIAGIDPQTQSQGSVDLAIEVDGEEVFKQTIDGTAEPVAIDLDIAGKQRLKLIVDYGENLDLGDRLHLVDARLVK